MIEKPNEFASQLCIDRGCQVVEGRIAELEAALLERDSTIARLKGMLDEGQAYYAICHEEDTDKLKAEIARLREALVDIDDLLHRDELDPHVKVSRCRPIAEQDLQESSVLEAGDV